MTRALLDGALLAAALPVVAASAYLLLLAACSRRRPAPTPVAPRLRFAVVVPAHDEEAGIAETVASLLAVDYPAALRRVVVVADNCSDATEDRARAAGALVLSRRDPSRRGKGYALDFAFSRLLEEGWADAVAVVDADTTADARLLRAFAARLDAGALAVQADYGVRNPEVSWRTRLMAIALALVNTLRCAGRERLRCSVGLRGNGMCFASRLLREVPHRAFTIVEDLEYGVLLGLRGHRVWFAGEARVLGEMVASGGASRSQRRRWEDGRRQVARQHGWSLLRQGLARRDRILLDLATDLLVPPLARLGAMAAAGLAVSALLARWTGLALLAPWAWAAALAALLAYVARGWRLSGTGLRGLGALLATPAYLAWKIALALGHRQSGPRTTWVRTQRTRK